MPLRFSSSVTIVLFLLFAACRKEESDAPLTASSAPPPGKALDPDLAQAVAAASAQTPGQVAADQDGVPPPNGVFPPGRADREAPKGSTPKLTLGSEGSDPKLLLAPAQPKPGSKTSGTILVEVQTDPRQPGLPIAFSVTLEAQKPTGAAATEPGPVAVTARVTKAEIDLPGAPPEVARDIASLRGSKIEYQLLPDGAGTGFRFELPAGAEPALADSVRALSDTLAVFSLPYPDRAVGAGAYWMSTSRDGVFGLDLVSYRLVRVERIADGRATLSVNTKRYSASSTLDLDGLSPTDPRDLLQFQALAEGSLEVLPGSGFPLSGKQESVLGATVGRGKQPAGGLQIRTTSRVELGQ